MMTGVRDILLLRDKVDRLDAGFREMGGELRDHEVRLVRMETLVEVAAGRPSKPRLLRR